MVTYINHFYKIPQLCQNCRRETSNDVLFLRLGAFAVARESCRHCLPGQIDILSSDIPMAIGSLQNNKIKELECEIMVSRIYRENYTDQICSIPLNFPTTKYPISHILDSFSVRKLEPGDRITFSDDEELKECVVKYHFKKVKVVSVVPVVPQSEEERAFTHNALIQSGARLVMNCYREKRSWLRRPILSEDVWWWNGWDWEVVNKWIEYRAVTKVTFFHTSEEYTRRLVRIADHQRSRIQEKYISTDSYVGLSSSKVIALLLWKRRRTEDSFQMRLISQRQAIQEFTMYQTFYSNYFAKMSPNESLGFNQMFRQNL